MTSHQDATNGPGLHRQPWQVVAEEEQLSAPPWVRVVCQHVRLPNGVEIADFYKIDAPDYVSIFALTPAQEVVTVEQYRHGVGEAVLELPAGNIETVPDQAAALATARRELREETGFVAAEWHFMGRRQIDSNRGMGAMYAFLALEATSAGQPALEATEIIQVRRVPLATLRQLWLDGGIKTIASCATTGLALAHLQERLQDRKGGHLTP